MPTGTGLGGRRSLGIFTGTRPRGQDASACVVKGLRPTKQTDTAAGPSVSETTDV